MNEDNPYAVSESCIGSSDVATDMADRAGFLIDGDWIVCGRRVILPQVCPITGATEELVQVTQVTEFPSFRLVISQRQCQVSYWLSRREMQRRKFISAGCIAAGALGAAAIAIGLAAMLGFIGVLGLATLCGAILLLHRNSLPLAVERFQKPNTYWLRGFSPKYLNRIQSWAQSWPDPNDATLRRQSAK